MTKLYSMLLVLALAFTSMSSFADGNGHHSLYKRMGGEPVVRAIVDDIWINHGKNPIVKNRFINTNETYLKKLVFEIFAVATGATDVKYTGKDLKASHVGMNISEMEFNAVVDDIMNAMESNKVSKPHQGEVLAILWATRPAIVNTNVTTDTLVK